MSVENTCLDPIVTRADIQLLQNVLGKMRVNVPKKASSQSALKRELCQMIKEQQAVIVDDNKCDMEDLPPERQIRLRINQETKCYDVIALSTALQKDPILRARFSKSQLQRIERQISLLKTPMDERPCQAASGMKFICLQNPNCVYNERTLVGALVGAENSKYNEGECYPNQAHVRSIIESCSAESPVNSLIVVLMDMAHRAFLLEHLSSSGFERDVVLQAMHQLHDFLETLRLNLKTKTSNELCLLVKENAPWYLSSTSSWLSNDTHQQARVVVESAIQQHLKSGEAFLDLLGANWIPLTTFRHLITSIQSILPQEEWTDTLIKLTHFAVNAALWTYSTLFVSYAVFYFLTPGGWALLRSLRDKPDALVLMGIIMSLFLDDQSFVLDILKSLHLSTEKLHEYVQLSSKWQKLVLARVSADVTTGVVLRSIHKKLSRKK